MKDLEIWLRQHGWEFKDFWWQNPRFPGKKYGYEAAVKIQERLEEREKRANDPRAGGDRELPFEEEKEEPYWKTHEAEK